MGSKKCTLFQKSKNPSVGALRFLVPLNRRVSRRSNTMPEIIAVILKYVEVTMEKYGFVKVTGSILFGIFLWQFSNIINACAKLIEVVR